MSIDVRCDPVLEQDWFNQFNYLRGFTVSATAGSQRVMADHQLSPGR